MRTIIVVFGVLAAFLVVLTVAYGVDNATWGSIKANLEKSSEKAASDLQLLPYAAFRRISAKTTGESTAETITASEGGKLQLPLGWLKMEVKIKRDALSADMMLTLAVQDDQGIPWFVVNGSIDQTCDPPADLKIYAQVLLSQVDPNTLVLMHWDEGGNVELVEGAKIIVQVDEQQGTGDIHVQADLHKFSRYALAGSRQ